MAVRASEVKYEIAPEGARDYAPLLGIFGLVAYIYNKVSLNAPQLLKTIAWCAPHAMSYWHLVFSPAPWHNGQSCACRCLSAACCIRRMRSYIRSRPCD